MAADGRGPADVRREIEHEREELARAADVLREELGEATDVAGKLRVKLPLAAGGALAAGFVLTGGIGATMRFLARKSREGEIVIKARRGRFALVRRD